MRRVLHCTLPPELVHRPILHDLGFTWVTLDLEGFRSGSMNAALGDRP